MELLDSVARQSGINLEGSQRLMIIALCLTGIKTSLFNGLLKSWKVSHVAGIGNSYVTFEVMYTMNSSDPE